MISNKADGNRRRLPLRGWSATGQGLGIASSARIVIEGAKNSAREDFMALVRKIFIPKLIHFRGTYLRVNCDLLATPAVIIIYSIHGYMVPELLHTVKRRKSLRKSRPSRFSLVHGQNLYTAVARK